MIPGVFSAAAGGVSSRIYATLNPADKGADTGIVLGSGNMTATVGASPTAGRYYLARATMGKSSGVWYWETTIFRSGDLANNYSYGSCVLCDDSYAMEHAAADYPGLTESVAGGPYFQDGTYAGGVRVKVISSEIGQRIVRHLLDMDAGTYEQAFDDGAFSTVMSGLSGAMYPAVMCREAATPLGPKGYATQNFGQVAFSYPVPSGANPGVFV